MIGTRTRFPSVLALLIGAVVALLLAWVAACNVGWFVPIVLIVIAAALLITAIVTAFRRRAHR